MNVFRREALVAAAILTIIWHQEFRVWWKLGRNIVLDLALQAIGHHDSYPEIHSGTHKRTFHVSNRFTGASVRTNGTKSYAHKETTLTISGCLHTLLHSVSSYQFRLIFL